MPKAQLVAGPTYLCISRLPHRLRSVQTAVPPPGFENLGDGYITEDGVAISWADAFNEEFILNEQNPIETFRDRQGISVAVSIKDMRVETLARAFDVDMEEYVPLGPATNSFDGADRAAAELARNTYAGAQAAWLGQYNGDRTLLIRLTGFAAAPIYQRRNEAGDDWEDVAAPPMVRRADLEAEIKAHKFSLVLIGGSPYERSGGPKRANFWWPHAQVSAIAGPAYTKRASMLGLTFRLLIDDLPDWTGIASAGAAVGANTVTVHNYGLAGAPARPFDADLLAPSGATERVSVTALTATRATLGAALTQAFPAGSVLGTVAATKTVGRYLATT